MQAEQVLVNRRGVSSGDRALVHSHSNFAYKMVAQMTTQMIE